MHDWFCRKDDKKLREKFQIPTPEEWDKMHLDVKAHTVNDRLHWADEAGVPHNSQIREILGGMVRTLTEEWMTASKANWKTLANVPAPKSMNFLFSERLPVDMRFSQTLRVI